MTPDVDLTTIGKILGGALVVGGAAWGIVRKFLSDKRDDGVAAARASVDTASLDAYDRTITMLRQDVDKIRADKEAADTKWRQDMATLEGRLQQVSSQADAAITRAQQAEQLVDKLRAQLRAANLEPCV